MTRVREICDKYGILLIHDEVMSGGGRTGAFLSHDHWPDCRADLIVMAKGIGAGYLPLGLVLAPRDLVETVASGGGFLHGTTALGNPRSCGVGLAVLEETLERGLVERSAVLGAELKTRLWDMANRYPIIGDVRGKGLLLAFELVSDRETLKPLPVRDDAYIKLVEHAYERGLIIYSRRTRGGREGDHFLVCPPS